MYTILLLAAAELLDPEREIKKFHPCTRSLSPGRTNCCCWRPYVCYEICLVCPSFVRPGSDRSAAAASAEDFGLLYCSSMNYLLE